MIEKDFQIEFKNKNNNLGVFELKIEKGKSIRVDRLAKHQAESLYREEFDHLYHKIADVGYSLNPYDCSNIGGFPASVVIMFYKQRVKKDVYHVRIDKWVRRCNELEEGKKLLKEEDIKEIAEYHFCYLKEKKKSQEYEFPDHFKNYIDRFY